MAEKLNHASFDDVAEIKILIGYDFLSTKDTTFVNEVNY